MNFNNLIPIADAPKYIPFKVKTLRNWRTGKKYPDIFVKISGKVFIDLAKFEQVMLRETGNP
jgi:hypothetical protein